jgi:hypothetical protein
MTFIIERNSQQRGRRTGIGTLGSRQLVWIKTPQTEAWTCSACAWVFSPSGPPSGNTLDEMMNNFELRRDKEFASHVCTECPRQQSIRDQSKFSIHQRIEHPVRAKSVGMSAKA